MFLWAELCLGFEGVVAFFFFSFFFKFLTVFPVAPSRYLVISHCKLTLDLLKDFCT